MTANLRTEALRLVEIGFAVFPVFQREANGLCGCGDPACRNIAKHPATRNGLRDATRSPLVIECWYRVRSYNTGITTGAPAIVLDVDPRHGGDQSIAELEAKHGPLPVTWRVFTGGGGEHIYLAPPVGRTIPNSANKLGPGLDIRGHGGYVVAPPSIHASGQEYVWNVDGHPSEVPLAPMPEWLVEAVAGPATSTTRFDAAGFVGAGIVEGARNAKLTSICGYLMRRLPPSDALLILDIIWGLNVSKCVPPLSRAEVEKIAGSIASRELRRRYAA